MATALGLVALTAVACPCMGAGVGAAAAFAHAPAQPTSVSSPPRGRGGVQRLRTVAMDMPIGGYGAGWSTMAATTPLDAKPATAPSSLTRRVVMKFGGSSLADATRIDHVARLVRDQVRCRGSSAHRPPYVVDVIHAVIHDGTRDSRPRRRRSHLACLLFCSFFSCSLPRWIPVHDTDDRNAGRARGRRSDRRALGDGQDDQRAARRRRRRARGGRGVPQPRRAGGGRQHGGGEHGNDGRGGRRRGRAGRGARARDDRDARARCGRVWRRARGSSADDARHPLLLSSVLLCDISPDAMRRAVLALETAVARRGGARQRDLPSRCDASPA